MIPRDTTEASPPEVWFEVYGKRYEMPVDLTFGEADLFKEVAGQTLEQVTATGGMDTQALAAMVLIALRRVDKTVTKADIASLVITDTLQTSTPEVAADPLALTPETTSPVSAPGSETGPAGPNPETTPNASGDHG